RFPEDDLVGPPGPEVTHAAALLDNGDGGHLGQVDLDGAVEGELIEERLGGWGRGISVLELEVAEAGLDGLGVDPTESIRGHCLRASHGALLSRRRSSKNAPPLPVSYFAYPGRPGALVCPAPPSVRTLHRWWLPGAVGDLLFRDVEPQRQLEQALLR